MELVDAIRGYIALQSRLLEVFATSVGALDREHFDGLGRGEVVVDGVAWRYTGHGRGISFQGPDDRLVNPHVVPYLHDAIDAWRLVFYLESIRIEHVVHRRARRAVEEEADVESMLEELVVDGALVKRVIMESKVRRIYGPGKGLRTS